MASHSPRSMSAASTISSSKSQGGSRHSTVSVQSKAEPIAQPSNPFQPPPTQWTPDVQQQYQPSMPMPGSAPFPQSALLPHSMPHASYQIPHQMHGYPEAFGSGSRVDSPAFSAVEYEGDGGDLLGPTNGVNADGSRRKKGSATSAANEIELKRLYQENRHRSLEDIAREVAKNDRGSTAEKIKQIFGMVWLSTHCESSTQSVPRNRVYVSYTDRCSAEMVPPLNPASFGKLVRIIFPNIQTRRLGIRGCSKYHYVELTLKDNTPSRNPPPPIDSNVLHGGFGSSINQIRNRTSGNCLSADTAFFPSSESPSSEMRSSLKRRNESDSCTLSSVYLWSLLSNGRTHTIKVARPLKFPTAVPATIHGKIQIDLPELTPYLPQDVDTDAVKSLTSVYRSHCILAIEHFRLCKTEKLADNYKSLVGLLTVPSQKLLQNPAIATWIRKCDWLKYQKMTSILHEILLHKVPHKAMLHMEFVAKNLCSWITQFFSSQPQHLQDAMLGPANIFISLVERFLRVNRAALDASDTFSDAETRDHLFSDWVTRVFPYQVVQDSLPFAHGHKRDLHILTQEVQQLLGPLSTSRLVSHGTIFDPALADPSSAPIPSLTFDDSASIIERLSAFLSHLPARFPAVDARTLLSYIETVGNNISRNLTLNGSSSLANFWKLKLFIDEYSYWLAQKGGFLETNADGRSVQLLETNDFDLPNLETSTFSPAALPKRRKMDHQTDHMDKVGGEPETNDTQDDSGIAMDFDFANMGAEVGSS